MGQFVQLREAETRFQVLLRLRQRVQLLVGCSVIVQFVLPLTLATRIQADGGKSAGAMKVQVGIEVCRVELLQAFGMLGRNVAVADVLAYNGAVLAFHQRVVLRSVGTAFGELDAQFLQQPGHRVIDEFRAIV